MTCPKCKNPLHWEQCDLGEPRKGKDNVCNIELYCPACKSLWSATVTADQLRECCPKTGKPMK